MRGRRLYLLLTRSLCRGEPLKVLEQALLGGVDLVQLREKPLRRADLPWIQEVHSLCAEREVPLVLNDRMDLAKELGLGVHLGQEDLRELRHRAGSRGLTDIPFGLSTHSPAEVEAALALHPSYIGIGPCFATPTKGYQAGLPSRALAQMQALAQEKGCPAFAIGGIQAENLAALLALGIRRVAVSSFILKALSPRLAAQELQEILLSPPEGGTPSSRPR